MFVWQWWTSFEGTRSSSPWLTLGANTTCHPKESLVRKNLGEKVISMSWWQRKWDYSEQNFRTMNSCMVTLHHRDMASNCEDEQLRSVDMCCLGRSARIFKASLWTSRRRNERALKFYVKITHTHTQASPSFLAPPPAIQNVTNCSQLLLLLITARTAAICWPCSSWCPWIFWVEVHTAHSSIATINHSAEKSSGIMLTVCNSW